MPDDVCERAGAMTAVQRSGQGSCLSLVARPAASACARRSGSRSERCSRGRWSAPASSTTTRPTACCGAATWRTAARRTSASRSPPRRTRWRRSPGIVLTPFGDAGQTLWVVIAFLALGALGWLTYELGAHWFGPAAGVVAALLILTRDPGAELRRARVRRHPVRRARARRDPGRGARPRTRRSSLILLAPRGPAAARGVAVLVRLRRLEAGPRGCCRCAAAAPVHLDGRTTSILTGDPLHSLTGTRDNAEDAAADHRASTTCPLTVPRRLGEILREPGLLGAAAGGILVLAFMRRRAALPIAAGFVSIAAFCVLAAAGPADPRPLPAAAGRAAGGLLRRGRLRLARAAARPPVAHPLGDDRRRWCWRRLVVFAPGQADRIATCARRWARRRTSSPTCTRSATTCPCRAGRGPEPPPGAARRALDRHPAGRDRLRAARAAHVAASTSTRRTSACCATSRSTRATRSG